MKAIDEGPINYYYGGFLDEGSINYCYGGTNFFFCHLKKKQSTYHHNRS